MTFNELVDHHKRVQEIARWWNRRNAPMKSRSRPKSLTQFIRENRTEIDAAIKRVCDNCRLNDRERRLWILNDESLYRWARSSGIKI